MSKQKIIRTGNSLAVTVPSDFAKSVGIKAGEEVKVRISPEKAEVTYIFSGLKQLPLAKGLIK